MCHRKPVDFMQAELVVFNEEYFFDDVNADDLEHKSICLEFFRRPGRQRMALSSRDLLKHQNHSSDLPLAPTKLACLKQQLLSGFAFGRQPFEVIGRVTMPLQSLCFNKEIRVSTPIQPIIPKVSLSVSDFNSKHIYCHKIAQKYFYRNPERFI